MGNGKLLPSNVTRRAVLAIGASALTSQALGALGCGGGDSNSSGAASGGGSDGSGGATTGSGAGGAGGAGGSGSPSTGTQSGSGGSGGSTASGNNTSGWATGGTAALGDNYPDPFAGGLTAPCVMSCLQPRGPCHAMTIVRKDVSEGFPGVPMRLALLIVDEDCQPVEGADVEIWHTSNVGLYSGADAITYCTHDDPAAVANRWFRGQQTTDANGRVDFDSCFPGAYPGRTVHIHFTVRVGDQEYVVLQFFVDQSVIDEIYAGHPDYAVFGTPDTPNAIDGIYTPNEVLDVQKMDDGAMLASKVVVLRNSLTETLCVE